MVDSIYSHDVLVNVNAAFGGTIRRPHDRPLITTDNFTLETLLFQCNWLAENQLFMDGNKRTAVYYLVAGLRKKEIKVSRLTIHLICYYFSSNFRIDMAFITFATNHATGKALLTNFQDVDILLECSTVYKNIAYLQTMYAEKEMLKYRLAKHTSLAAFKIYKLMPLFQHSA